jgi:hypothetical protein
LSADQRPVIAWDVGVANAVAVAVADEGGAHHRYRSNINNLSRLERQHRKNAIAKFQLRS